MGATLSDPIRRQPGARGPAPPSARWSASRGAFRSVRSPSTTFASPSGCCTARTDAAWSIHRISSHHRLLHRADRRRAAGEGGMNSRRFAARLQIKVCLWRQISTATSPERRPSGLAAGPACGRNWLGPGPCALRFRRAADDGESLSSVAPPRNPVQSLAGAIFTGWGPRSRLYRSTGLKKPSLGPICTDTTLTHDRRLKASCEKPLF